MATRPTPGAVRARREIPEIGVTVLTLSNGVEVWLKPTDFRNDQVSFTAYSRGGHVAGDAGGVSRCVAEHRARRLSGRGWISPVDLDKVLAGQIASASAFMSNYTHGVSGGRRRATSRPRCSSCTCISRRPTAIPRPSS